jgi:hypothetical protein
MGLRPDTSDILAPTCVGARDAYLDGVALTTAVRFK